MFISSKTKTNNVTSNNAAYKLSKACVDEHKAKIKRKKRIFLVLKMKAENEGFEGFFKPLEGLGVVKIANYCGFSHLPIGCDFESQVCGASFFVRRLSSESEVFLCFALLSKKIWRMRKTDLIYFSIWPSSA
ncbi:hypothetical protein SUGI_0879970 [Cryptomeria japonica]|nr:hypothetical protein SUGI_0879970 [Cryptomeria japonica]